MGYLNAGSLEDSGELALLSNLKNLKPKICVDVGANVGDFSRELLNRTNAQVFAFEPLPKTQPLLHKLKDGFPERFQFFPIAISDKSLHLPIFGHSELDERASLISPATLPAGLVGLEKLAEVKTESFDSLHIKTGFEFLRAIDFLKIDVEGFEIKVLGGMQELLRDYPPAVIQLEMNVHHKAQGQSLLTVSEMLPGYEAYQVLPRENGLKKRSPHTFHSSLGFYSNFIFVRDARDAVKLGA